jgi:tetratricopeptide (TPR) repeat protein
MRPILFVTLIAAATTSIPRPAHARQADGRWVGRRVVTLFGAAFRPADRGANDRPTSEDLGRPGREHQDFRVYRVESVDGPWLLVAAEKDSVRGWVATGQVLLLDQAITYYTSLIDSDSTATESYSRRGLIWAEKGELDLALADYDEAIRLDPTRAVVYLNRGIVRRDRKEYARALVDLDKAIELDPDYARSYLNRGMLWALKHEHDLALADFDRAIRLDPRSSWAHNNRGVSRQEKKEYDRALADYDEAIRLDPRNATAYLNRSAIRRVKREYAGALDDIDRAIRLDPADPSGYNARSWLRATCPEARYRDGEGAVDDALRSVRLRKEKDPFDLGTLAAAYAERGDFARAVEVQAKAQALYKKESDLKDGRARLDVFKGGKPFREADGESDRTAQVPPDRVDDASRTGDGRSDTSAGHATVH